MTDDARYAARSWGSALTTTVSATGMLWSTASCARDACSRMASGPLAWLMQTAN
jgi:hypothetical protein